MSRETTGEELTVGILAGGKSRRLGLDKGLIPWRGRSLLEWSAYRAAALGGELYILAKERAPYEGFGYPVLTDFSSSLTPLSGILTVIPFVKDWLLLLACDILILSDGLLPLLWDKRREGRAVVVHSPQGYQPFLGLYPRRELQRWEDAYRRGSYKLQPVVEQMDKIVCPQESLEAELGGGPLFLNINRPEDLRKLRLQELNRTSNGVKEP
ncbi:MAG TPA: molybdenum cofactor guanylyltransferase [Sediminispirochaeta sp.]|nr:molybdenum cofactor guanylyltransferase [Sediminispirochaeta sp.]